MKLPKGTKRQKNLRTFRAFSALRGSASQLTEGRFIFGRYDIKTIDKSPLLVQNY